MRLATSYLTDSPHRPKRALVNRWMNNEGKITMRIMILGASYGSLLSTKLLMAGHDVTLICRNGTADLINAEGTEVRIKLRDEDSHRAFVSGDYPGEVDAVTPENARPEDYDMIAWRCRSSVSAGPVRELLNRVALSGKPACRS